MFLSNRRMTRDHSTVTFLMFVLAAGACSSDETGSASLGTSSEGTSAATTPTPTTTDAIIEFDEMICEPKHCVENADCCEDREELANCPEGPYPNFWTCVNGDCRNDGCLDQSDCIISGLDCLVVNLIGYCVVPCVVVDDIDPCSDLLPGTHCVGMSTTSNFCLEGPLP